MVLYESGDGASPSSNKERGYGRSGIQHYLVFEGNDSLPRHTGGAEAA